MRMASAAFMPVTMSTTGKPTRVGSPPATPLTLIRPHIAWAQASYPGRPPSGPSPPKPLILQ